MKKRLGLLTCAVVCLWFACASPLDLVGIRCRSQSDCPGLHCVAGVCQANPGKELQPEPPVDEPAELLPEDAADIGPEPPPEPTPEDGSDGPDTPDVTPSCQPTLLHRDFTLTGHTANIEWLAFSPKNPRQVATASRDTTIKVWDVSQGKLVSTLSDPSLKQPFVQVSWSDDALHLFSIYGDNRVLRPALWDVLGGKRIANVSWPSGFTTVPCGTFAADPDWIWLCGDFSGKPAVVRWSISAKKYDQRLLADHSQALSVLARHTGVNATYLAAGASKGAVTVWDVTHNARKSLIDTTDNQLKVLGLAHLTEVLVVRFVSHNNKPLLATQSREAVKLWDVQSGALLGSLPIPSMSMSQPRRAAISDDGAFVALPLDTSIAIYEGSFASDATWSAKKLRAISYQEYETLLLQQNNFTRALQFQPGKPSRLFDAGRRLLGWKNEPGVAAGKALSERFSAHYDSGLTGPVRQVVLRADGAHVFGFATGRALIRMWALKTSEFVRAFSVDGGTFSSMAAGQKYLAAAVGARLVVWEIDSGKIVLDRTEASDLRALLFRPGTDTLVATNGSKSLLIWKDVVDSNPVVVDAHAEKIGDLSASGDGAWLASLSDDEEVKIWRWKDDGALDANPVHSNKFARPYHHIALAPDGVTVYAVFKSGAGEVVDRLDLSDESKTQQGLTPAFGGGNTNVPQALLSLSGDGKLLAVASSDFVLQLFDVSGQTAVRRNNDHYKFRREVTSTQLLSSGENLLLVVGSLDRSIRVIRCP